MRGRVEVSRLVFMAGLATFRAHKGCPGNTRWRHDCARGTAGNQDEGYRCSTARQPEPIRALRGELSSCAQSPHVPQSGDTSKQRLRIFTKKRAAKVRRRSGLNLL